MGDYLKKAIFEEIIQVGIGLDETEFKSLCEDVFGAILQNPFIRHELKSIAFE